MGTDLKSVLRERIVDDMIQSSKSKPSEFMVLVGDDSTIKVLSSCLRMQQMNEAGVGVVLNVKYDREHMKFPALYFMEPNMDNAKILVQDFKNKKRPCYSSVHLFFNGNIGQDVMSTISESGTLLKHLKTCKEIYLDFLSNESRYFSLNRPTTIPSLYFTKVTVAERDAEIERTASQLVSLCITLKELPYIRYCKRSKGGSICQRLAKEVDKRLNAAVASMKEWTYTPDRATLVIMDRSLEPVCPLMHEYTYQAMSADLLTMDGERCIVDKNEADSKDDPILLNEEDEFWVEYRHQHVSNVLQGVTSKFNEFRATNKIASMKSKDAAEVSASDIKQAMRQIPQYRKQMSSYVRHMTVADKCLKLYQQNNLYEISQLEQDMATGLDEDMNHTDMKVIERKLSQIIQNKELNTEDKLRLVMIYIITQDGINEGTRKALFRVANFSDMQQEAVTNLFELGVSLQQSSSKNRAKKWDKEALNRSRARAENVPLELMRYVPQLENILEKQLSDTLSQDDYPYISQPPPRSSVAQKQQTSNQGRSRRVRKTAGLRGGNQEQASDLGPRLITFMMGGVTYSEIRVVYDLCESKKKDIIIGSTSVVTPDSYIRDLSAMGKVNLPAGAFEVDSGYDSGGY
eukprot:93124_1